MITLKKQLTTLALALVLLGTPAVVEAKPFIGKETLYGHVYEQLDGSCWQEVTTNTYFFGIRTNSTTTWERVPC